MSAYLIIILRLLVILVIGIMTYLILSKLITWPQRSKAKRTGQIIEDNTNTKSKVIKVYLLVWLVFIVVGYFTIRYLL